MSKITNEWLLIVFISCVLFYSYAGIYISRQTGASIPRWPSLIKSRDYTFYIIYICSIALIINTIISLMGEYSLFYLFLIGLVLMFFGIYLNILARKELGRYWSPLSSSDNSEKLIKSGIYARVRHPIYLSNLIFFLGVTLIAGSWYSWILFILFLGGLRKRVKKEEEELYKKFGEEYRIYAKETPLILPRLRR